MRRSFFLGYSLLCVHLFHVASLQAQCDCGRKKPPVEKCSLMVASFHGGCSCEGSSGGTGDIPDDES